MTQTPIHNTRVIAFTHFAAGPIAAQYLGALGADVIKVESPKRDLNRYAIRDPEDALNGVSPYFVCTNRNQRGVVLDLKSEAGLEAARKLITSADVVLENYRPGVMDKLGLGYEDARRLKSDIVYCSFSAYDSTGPARDRPGQDLLMQALSGLASLSGRVDDPPVPVGAYVIDGFTAMQGVIGILSALLYRTTSGEGQHVRADMMSTALYMMTQEASFVANAGQMIERTRAGLAHVNHGAPYGIYKVSDGAIAISVFGGSDVIRGLAVALKVEDELDDYLTERGLKVNRDEIALAFARSLANLSLDEATERLTAAGAWVAPVRTIAEAMRDPAVQETGIVRHYSPPGMVQHTVVTEPLQMSATPLRRDLAAPTHGEHTLEVLRELGYDEAAARSLAESTSTAVPPVRSDNSNKSSA